MKLAKLISGTETPTADEAADALATLNDVLENWDTQPLALWSTTNFTGALVGGQASYTIGPGGDLNTTRPSQINGAFVQFNGVDFPVQPIGQLERTVRWQDRRRGVGNLVKSAVRLALARMGSGIADPHIVTWAYRPAGPA